MSPEQATLIEDWNAMVTAVALFSEKHELPKGELIFPPIVLDNLRDACEERLLDTFIVNGIRARGSAASNKRMSSGNIDALRRRRF